MTLNRIALPSVLVVEDQPAMRLLLERMLRLHGFRPLEAATCVDALAMAEQAPVGAFIIDLHLTGGQSGLHLLACLRKQFPERDTPVFILTGDRDLAQADYSAIDRHHARLFYKGESLSALIEAIHASMAPSTAAHEPSACAFDRPLASS